MKNYLVFDAGGTFTKYALMNENAEILEKDKVPTPDYHTKTKEDYYAVLDSVVEKYKNRIEGIAISMPGMLDNRNGYCVTAGYLAYLAGSTVGTELSQRYGIPVSVENDGKCAALAEFWRGSLKGCTNGAVVVIGTGVAGGIILNGKLFRGNHFTAGEYSYICTEAKDPAELLSFKEGSLKIAEKSGCPVVPVAITGTAEILEKHFPFIRPSHVTIEFGEPFYIKELPAEDRKRAGAYSEARIREMLVKEQEERRGLRRA